MGAEKDLEKTTTLQQKEYSIMKKKLKKLKTERNLIVNMCPNSKLNVVGLRKHLAIIDETIKEAEEMLKKLEVR